MNAPAFTPGPWKRDAEDARYIRSVKTKEYIAARQSSNPADSALLAASPDLYEALKHCVDLLEVTDKIEAARDPFHPLNAARAALAKVAP